RSNRPEPPKARETDPNPNPDSSLSERGKPRLLNKPAIDLKLFSVFFNGIGQKQTFAVQRACPLYPESGHSSVRSECRLRAKSGPMHCSANQQIIDNSFGWRLKEIARERQHQARHDRATDHR